MQFGPGAMQQHGFARNLEWEISSTSADLQPDERDPEVELVLTDNDYTRAMWYAPGSILQSRPWGKRCTIRSVFRSQQELASRLSSLPHQRYAPEMWNAMTNFAWSNRPHAVS